MSVEALLARLYTDAALRREFLRDPPAIAIREGVGHEDAQRLAAIDRSGLELAARSYAGKRASHGRTSPWRRWWRSMANRF